MRKLIVFVLAFLAFSTIQAQENKKKEAIKSVIDSFFEGLHYGDSSKIRTTIHKDLKIHNFIKKIKAEKDNPKPINLEYL